MVDSITWSWNVGKGNITQRTLALIHTAIDHPNPVTRYVCREILAKQLVELTKKFDETITKKSLSLK